MPHGVVYNWCLQTFTTEVANTPKSFPALPQAGRCGSTSKYPKWQGSGSLSFPTTAHRSPYYLGTSRPQMQVEELRNLNSRHPFFVIATTDDAPRPHASSPSVAAIYSS